MMRYAERWMIALLATGACMQAQVTVAEKPTIKQVIKAIQANERLYDKIEMTVEYRYKLEKAENKSTAKGRPIDSLRDRIRVVIDGNRFYYNQKRLSYLDEDEEKTVRSAATATFDGKQTRVLRSHPKSTTATIHHSRHLPWGMLLPNTFLRNSWDQLRPFSRFLQASDLSGSNLHWKMMGKEKLDGLSCLKLQLKSVNPFDGKTGYRQIFWLAVNRNYQPVKLVTYSPRFSTTLPHFMSRVTKFIKLKPGVWLPAKTETTNYNMETLQRKGEHVVYSRTSFTVRKAVLDPKLDEALFKPVTIPAGTPVAEYRGGKVVKRYRQK